MKQINILTVIGLVSVLGLAACDSRTGTTSVVPTPVSVISTASQPTSTRTPTTTVSLILMQTPGPTPTETPARSPFSTPTPGGPVWRILFKGAPCSEMLNPGCQPFDGTPSYLHAINSNGTDLEKIDVIPEGSSLVQFSSDGTRLAYVMEDGLYVTNTIGGTDAIKVLDGWIDFDFYHDGERLAYASSTEYQSPPNQPIDPGMMFTEIGTVRIDGSECITLTTIPVVGVDIHVSPDGNWILAHGFARDHVTRHLYVIRADSGETRELFSSRSMGAIHWSERGQIEFWVYEHEADLNTLYLMDVEGKNLSPTFTVSGINSSLDVGDWSPDGEAFAFMWGDDLTLLDLNSGHWYPILSGYSISMGSVTSCGPRCPW